MENSLSTSYMKEKFVEICTPDVDSSLKDVYKMLIYEKPSGYVLAAIDINDKVIINGFDMDLGTANRLFDEFKIFIRNAKINSLI